MYSTIVVGTDGSGTAQTAVARAGELASLCGATLHLVHGCGTATVVADGMLAVPVALNEDTVADLEKALEDAAQPWRDKGVDVQCHVLRAGGPEAVLSAAEDQGADLIVIGNQGMSGKRRFLLGSVPNAVSHHAPCSVLIVQTT